MRQPRETSYGDALGVVIVTYSPGETLQRCLDTLVKATTRDVRVVIADNGSTDGAPEHATERAEVQLVPTGGNVGYGAAANRGVQRLADSVGWVVVANPDIEWSPGALDSLLDAAGRWDAAGSFGPLIQGQDGTIYPSARRFPSIGMGIGHALFARVWPDNPWSRRYRQADVAQVERATGWLSGSCLLVRREAFAAVGGFDERYFMYFEDVDFGDRLRRAGWLNVYVPSAAVTHVQGYSTSRDSVRMLTAHHTSAYRYLADRYRGWWWRPVLELIRVGLGIRLRLAVRARRRGGRAEPEPTEMGSAP